MPSHMRDSQLFNGGPNNSFKHIVGEKGGRAARIEKEPVFVLQTCSCLPELLESSQIAFAQPDWALAAMSFRRIDLPVMHRFPYPKTIVHPIDRAPVQSQ